MPIFNQKSKPKEKGKHKAQSSVFYFLIFNFYRKNGNFRGERILFLKEMEICFLFNLKLNFLMFSLSGNLNYIPLYFDYIR